MLKQKHSNALHIALFGIQSALAVTLPFNFSAGTPISASQMNANFQTLSNTSWSLTGSNIFYNSGFVGAGTTNPLSTLQTGGSFGVAIRTVTSATTLTSSDQTLLVNAAGGAITVTLPTAITGRIYTIKKIDTSTNAVTINTLSGATIDLAASALLNSPTAYANIASDGSNYWITGSNTLIAIGTNALHQVSAVCASGGTTIFHSAYGVSATVPSSGTYLVWYSARGYASSGSPGWSIALYDVTNSNTQLDSGYGNNVYTAAGTNGDNRITQTYIGPLTAGHTITVGQIIYGAGTLCTIDGNGGPSIHMVKTY